MTLKEAIESIIEAIPNIEDFADELEFIRSYNFDFESNGEDYETKYNKLREAYIEKFKESPIAEVKDKNETKKEEEKTYTLEELDFSGETE